MSVSDDVKELYKRTSDSTVNKNYILDIDGVTYDNENIVFGSFSLTEKLCSSEQLRFGECNASMLKLKMVADIGDISEKKIVLSQAINENSISIGQFNVNSCVLTENKQYRDIVAYDNIILFDKNVSDWYNSLKFPIKMNNMLISLCKYIGVDMADIQLINGEVEIDKTVNPEDLKGITVLKSIAELNGGFFRAAADGKIEFVVLNTDSTDDYLEVKHYRSLKTENYPTNKITRLVIRTSENDIGGSAGEGDNAYIIQDNFLLYGSSTEKLKTIASAIYEVVKNISYVPYTSEHIGLPYLKCGSQISYKLVSGENFVGLMLQRTLTGTQALKDMVKTSGTKDTKEVFSIEKELIKLKGKENLLERKVESNTLKIINTEENLSNEILQTAAQLRVKIETLEKQVAGEITVYTADEAPTLDNYPAVDWFVDYYPPADDSSAEDYMFPSEDNTWVYNDETYHKHLGSLVYVNGTTTAYKFIINDNNQYTWLILEDSETGYMLSKITELKASLEGIESTVSATTLKLDATIEETSTKFSQTDKYIEEKVVKNDEVIAKINASEEGIKIAGKAISLEGTTTINEYFTINEDGTMDAKGGKVGEWNIQDNKLVTSYETYVNPTIREAKIIREAILNGTTSSLPSAYDLNGDGRISLKDALAIQKIIHGYNNYSDVTNKTKTTVYVEISPINPIDAIKVYGVNAWGNSFENYIGAHGSSMDSSYVNGNPVATITKGSLSVGESVTEYADTGSIITVSFNSTSMVYVTTDDGIVRVDNGATASDCPIITKDGALIIIRTSKYACTYSITGQ